MATQKNKEPVIADEELKMPEHPFGAQTEVASKPSIFGPIIGLLIVLLVLILAGLYLWWSTFKDDLPAATLDDTRPTAEQNNEPESNNAEADEQTFQTVSTSDELSAIEADIESTNVETVDSESTAIESELEADAEQSTN